jgi:hypothetical protein
MKTNRFLGTLFALASCLATGQLAGQSTWGGLGGDANWDTAANWDVAPGAGANVIFATGIASGATIDMNGSQSVSSISLGDGGVGVTNYTVRGDGDTLSVTSGINFNNASSGNITLWPQTLNIGTNPIAMDVNGNGNFVIRGNILGTGQITKTGGHQVRFAGDNSGFSGGIRIETGNITAGFQTPASALDTVFGTGPITFAQTGAVTSTVNFNRSGAAPNWSNSFINDNAGTGSSQMRFTGGVQFGGVANVSGSFSVGANVADGTRFNFDAPVGFRDDNRSEGRWNLSGDWSAYTPGGTPVIAMGNGTLQFDAQQAIAPSTVR